MAPTSEIVWDEHFRAKIKRLLKRNRTDMAESGFRTSDIDVYFDVVDIFWDLKTNSRPPMKLAGVINKRIGGRLCLLQSRQPPYFNDTF